MDVSYKELGHFKYEARSVAVNPVHVHSTHRSARNVVVQYRRVKEALAHRKMLPTLSLRARNRHLLLF